MALITANLHTSANDIPTWVQFACATAMGLGTSIGGWKIIKTVGGKIMKIRPVNGVSADLTGGDHYFRRHVYSFAGQYNPRHFFINSWRRCVPPRKRRKLGYGQANAHYMGHHASDFSDTWCHRLLYFKYDILMSHRFCQRSGFFDGTGKPSGSLEYNKQNLFQM